MKLNYANSGSGSDAPVVENIITDGWGETYINTNERDFKELASYGLVVVGDVNYPWTLITLDGVFLKLRKDEHAIWHISFEREAHAEFGGFTSKTTALRSLRDYADKNGLELKIEYLSSDGRSRLRENPHAI